MARNIFQREIGRFLQNEIAKTANGAVRKAALAIVNDLQVLGPYWDGYFHDAWEVREGNVEIPADQQGQTKTRKSAAPNANTADFTLDDIPNPPTTFRSKPLELTIGNRMVYRDIAMDLVPGPTGEYRYERVGATADRDWYSTYVNGLMNSRVAEALRGRVNLSS